MCLTYKWTGLALRSHMITAECVGSSFARCLLSSSLHSDSSAQGGQLRTQSKASSASIIHACLHSHLHSYVPSQPSCVRMGLLECLLSDQHVVDLMQNKWPSVDPRAWCSGPDLAISPKSIWNQCRISGGTQRPISIYFSLSPRHMLDYAISSSSTPFPARSTVCACDAKASSHPPD